MNPDSLPPQEMRRITRGTFACPTMQFCIWPGAPWRPAVVTLSTCKHDLHNGRLICQQSVAAMQQKNPAGEAELPLSGGLATGKTAGVAL
jgi:hypothetical protein